MSGSWNFLKQKAADAGLTIKYGYSLSVGPVNESEIKTFFLSFYDDMNKIVATINDKDEANLRNLGFGFLWVYIKAGKTHETTQTTQTTQETTQTTTESETQANNALSSLFGLIKNIHDELGADNINHGSSVTIDGNNFNPMNIMLEKLIKEVESGTINEANLKLLKPILEGMESGAQSMLNMTSNGSFVNNIVNMISTSGLIEGSPVIPEADMDQLSQTIGNLNNTFVEKIQALKTAIENHENVDISDVDGQGVNEDGQEKS